MYLFKKISIICAVILFFVLSSCSSDNLYKEAFPLLTDGKYDSEFPYKGCSEQLEQISNSIKFVNCIAYYQNYVFDPNVKIKKSQLTSEVLDSITAFKSRYESSSSGTGLVIYYENRKIALLTCSHVVTNDDTVYYWRSDSYGNFTSDLSGIAVKIKEQIYVPDLPDAEFEIVKNDKHNDIAVIGKNGTPDHWKDVYVFNFPLGYARDLEWGSFVYIFGYPLGYKTVTKAIVSSPNRDKNGSFILDAFFNKGFSGGIVLAVRDGVPNFEMVGIIKAVFGAYDYVLVPEEDFDYYRHNPINPYSGKVFVNRKANIQYGISRAVPVEIIVNFLQDSREFFRRKGYFFDKLYIEEDSVSEK